eukprot:7902084-Pyramimonas_sp.AAC.1
MDSIIVCEGDGVSAHLEWQRKSAQLFAYSRAAFPSLLVQWLLFVLSRMGIPRWAVNVFANLYENNTALVHFCGVVLAQFSAGCGVCQVCPASMLLFALSLDP